LLTPERIRNCMDCAFMAHVAEKDSIVRPYHERKHAPAVGCGTPPFIQDDNIYVGQRPVLKIPDNTGELHQVIIQLFFTLTIQSH